MIERSINGITFLTGTWPLAKEKSTLVFIHGAGSSAIFWKHQIPSLSNDFNIVAIDLPGHGRSNEQGKDKISDYAEAVDQYVKYLNIESPVICGLSMGGAIAQQLLLDGKENYKAGIIINSGAKLKVNGMIFDMISDDFQGYADMFELVAISDKTDKSKLKYIVDDLRSMDSDVVYNDFIACNSFDVMGRLNEVKVPVLVLTAQEDKLSPPKYGSFIADAIDNSFHVSIKDAGHMSPVEKPEEVNTAINDFLNELT